MKTTHARAMVWAWTLVAISWMPSSHAAELGANDPRATVKQMFDATRAMNADGVVAQLASEVEPEIVYYWGETVSGREAIRQWHREWFEEKGWRLEPEQTGRVFADERVASISYTVDYIKSATRRFKILVACTLVREGEDWKIARMQQTLLDGPKD